jgi:hypothetical protein
MITRKQIDKINDIIIDEPKGFKLLLMWDEKKRSIGFTSFGNTISERSKGLNIGSQIQRLLLYTDKLIIPE